MPGTEQQGDQQRPSTAPSEPSVASTSAPRSSAVLSSKERYARATAARKARTDRDRETQAEARRALLEAEASSHPNHPQTVLAPPDPNNSGGRQLAGILGIMALVTVLIALLATFIG